MERLHDKQVKLLEILKENIDDPLTLRELQELLDISAPSVVHHHIRQLEKKGYLKRNPNNPKDYQILSDPEKRVVYLNHYGMAQCGPSGSILEGSPIDRIPIASQLLHHPSKDLFLVKARGDSMIPRIYPKDFVIAQQCDNKADDGDIVVCVYNGEALIKKYFKHAENNLVTLHSINTFKYPQFEIFEPDQNTFKIEGIVRYIISYNASENENATGD